MDQLSNEASIFNILEEITPESFPYALPKCAVVSLWRSEPGDTGKDFQLVTKVSTPGGQIQEIRTNFQMTRKRHRVVNYLLGVPIAQPGELKFEAVLNGEHAAEHVVTVEKRTD